ncbi:hypothetical protein JXD38_10835 [candidate division WOR-3 bacterium]|nr:hypothetical protein [candidate division WOR-3 bacterium]
MVSQVPQEEMQTPDAECQTAEGEDRVEESSPRYSAFRLPPEVTEPIEAAAREAGVEVYHAEFSGRELRVQVESAAGTSVDTCSSFSRALAPRLDAVNFLHRQYTLEVSSPGIERRLYQPQDFTRAVGKHVKVLVRGGWVEGVLESAGPDTIRLRVNRSQKAEGRKKKSEDRTPTCDDEAPREVAYAEIREAHVRVPDCELFASGRGQGVKESRNQARHSNPRILESSNPAERN